MLWQAYKIRADPVTHTLDTTHNVGLKLDGNMSKKIEEQQDCDSGYKSIESNLESLSLEDDTSSLEGSQPATQSGQQSRNDCSKEVENSIHNCFKIQDCAEVNNSEEKVGIHLPQDKDGDK